MGQHTRSHSLLPDSPMKVITEARARILGQRTLK